MIDRRSNKRHRLGYWTIGSIVSLLAVVACDVALNPQPLPPESSPTSDGGFTSSGPSDSGSRQDPAPAFESDAAGGASDSGLPPAPLLDGGDGGDADLDASLDADAN